MTAEAERSDDACDAYIDWVTESLGLSDGVTGAVGRYIALVHGSYSWQWLAWFDAKKTHIGGEYPSEAWNSMARTLQSTDRFATAPFTPFSEGDKWWIAASADPYRDYDDEGEILLIDPATGAMQRLGDTTPGFYGRHADDTAPLKLYSNGIAFARAWVAARLVRFDLIRRVGVLHRPEDWQASPCLPGMAMLGDLSKHRNFTDIAHAPGIELDDPRLIRPLADAMLRAANLPVIRPPSLRAAA